MSTTEPVGHISDDATVENQPTDARWLWFWGTLLGASLPMLIPYFSDMWAEPHYQYFPFVFLAVGFLAYQRSDRQLYPPQGWMGWSVTAMGIAAVLIGITSQAVWLGGVGFVLLLIAVAGSSRGPEDRSLIALALPLSMLIMLPLGLGTLLVQRLQDITTELSSVMLDLCGVSHAVEGNIINLPSRELFVADACSGIQSVFTLAFLASLIVAFMRRRLWLAPFYMTAAVLLAIAGNVVRVTTVALAEAWGGTDLSSGLAHEALGYTTLGLAAGLLVSFDRLVITALHPIEFTSDSMIDNPIAKLWNYLVGDQHGSSSNRAIAPAWLEQITDMMPVRYGFLGIVGLLGLSSVVQLARMQGTAPVATVYSSKAIYSPSADLLGDDYRLLSISDHSTSRDGNDPRLGENADLWQCEVDGMHGQIVLSQPYSGWHELCVCYENLDWDLLDRDVIDNPELKIIPDGLGDESYVTAKFKSEGGQQGYLMFSAISYDGTIPSAPGSFGAWGSRLMGRLDRNGIIDQTDIMMFQLWIPTNRKLEPRTLRRIQEDFVKARAEVARAIVKPNSSLATTTSDTPTADANSNDTATTDEE